MFRKLLVGALVTLVAGAVAYAGNVDRGVRVHTTALTLIGTCEPETFAATTLGWDQTPTAGNWGGKDESLFAVVWEPGTQDVAANAGRFAECMISGTSGKTPKKIRVNALEGLANDDYCVFASVGAGDLLIGCRDETTGTETWVTTDFDLPGGAFASGQDVTVKVLVTGNAWPSFNTWGQVGVDWIKVMGE